MKRVLLYMLLASFLTACVSSLSPVPEDRYYRLSEVAGKSSGRASLGGVLAIGTIENAGVYNERAILYSESTEPAKLQRLPLSLLDRRSTTPDTGPSCRLPAQGFCSKHSRERQGRGRLESLVVRQAAPF